ncbi:hypothetical protein SARC_16931, partial [Sphaeroforma arctica JP610]
NHRNHHNLTLTPQPSSDPHALPSVEHVHECGTSLPNAVDAIDRLLLHRSV